MPDPDWAWHGDLFRKWCAERQTITVKKADFRAVAPLVSGSFVIRSLSCLAFLAPCAPLPKQVPMPGPVWTRHRDFSCIFRQNQEKDREENSCGQSFSNPETRISTLKVYLRSYLGVQDELRGERSGDGPDCRGTNSTVAVRILHRSRPNAFRRYEDVGLVLLKSSYPDRVVSCQ